MRFRVFTLFSSRSHALRGLNRSEEPSNKNGSRTPRAPANRKTPWHSRTQLEQANQRARVLEQALQQRDMDLKQTNAQLADLQHTQEAERRAAVEERARLQDRYQASEAHSLGEVDRARQAVKAAEGFLREHQTKLAKALEEREASRSDLQEVRGQLATATAVRAQPEARQQAVSSSLPSTALTKGRRRSSARSAKTPKRTARR
jgi:chromosome segregation ATPase